MHLLTFSIPPLLLDAYLCYKCYIDKVWLTDYWALCLFLHTCLIFITTSLWCYSEYIMINDAITNEKHAAVLQLATRRKLANREPCRKRYTDSLDTIVYDSE